MIVGGIAGGVLGDIIAPGESEVLGTLPGAAGAAPAPANGPAPSLVANRDGLNSAA